MTTGRKIIDGLKDALAGKFGRVTIEGQKWVRLDEQHVIVPRYPTHEMLEAGDHARYPTRSTRANTEATWDAMLEKVK